ncbi:MAG: hypothetical protein IKM07_03875 [Clostridia bacterium]|nr:hypothetical protein [Clostridia bacterium]
MKIGKFCAHRGVSALMPENTLPAFGAALALGADEIEFDVRLSCDGQLIVSHDDSLERISDGTGKLCEKTLSELLTINAGHEKGWVVPFCTPEEVFAQFANKMIFNIHLKETGVEGSLVKELVRLAEKYDATGSIYFAGGEEQLYWMQKAAPEIPRVAIQFPDNAPRLYDIVCRYDCVGVQFWLGYFDEALINRLHERGAFCNLFWADDDEAYEKYFEMGVDTLLTNRMDLAAAWKKKVQ